MVVLERMEQHVIIQPAVATQGTPVRIRFEHEIQLGDDACPAAAPALHDRRDPERGKLLDLRVGDVGDQLSA